MILFPVLMIIAAVKIVRVNRNSAPVTQEDYFIGDEVLLGDNYFGSRTDCDYSDYSVKVEGYEILSYREYLDKYHYDEDPLFPLYRPDNSMYPEMIYDVDITFRNLNSKENMESGINLLPYMLYGTNFWMDTSDLLYQVSNPEMTDIMWQFMLRPGTSKTFHIPFFFQPSSKQWNVSIEQCQKDDIRLVVSEYPVRKVIHLEKELKR